MAQTRTILRRVALIPVYAYRYLISPCLPHGCRFYPSCSEYAVEAVEEHGIVRGGRLALTRLCRCHPWQAGGCDPVPPKPHSAEVSPR